MQFSLKTNYIVSFKLSMVFHCITFTHLIIVYKTVANVQITKTIIDHKLRPCIQSVLRRKIVRP